jgi:hypothetical protein
LVFHTKGRTENDGVREKSIEENIWTSDEEVTGSLRNLHSEQLHNSYLH